MQGSSGGASSLLYIYSAAVTVRFFDAVALALFAPDLRGRRFRTAVCNSRRLGRPRSLTPGSARALACSLRRLAAMLWGRKVRDGGAPLPAREARALPKRKRRLRNRRSLKRNTGQKTCIAHRLGSLCSQQPRPSSGGTRFCASRTRGSRSLHGILASQLFSGSDFRLANKTAVQFFVALRGS